MNEMLDRQARQHDLEPLDPAEIETATRSCVQALGHHFADHVGDADLTLLLGGLERHLQSFAHRMQFQTPSDDRGRVLSGLAVRSAAAAADAACRGAAAFGVHLRHATGLPPRIVRLAYFGYETVFSTEINTPAAIRAEANTRVLARFGTAPTAHYAEPGRPFPDYVPVQVWDDEDQHWSPMQSSLVPAGRPEAEAPARDVPAPGRTTPLGIKADASAIRRQT